MTFHRLITVVYLPEPGHLPKRTAEIMALHGLNDHPVLWVYPDDYEAILGAYKADTVHLIQLHPTTDTSVEVSREYFQHLPKVQDLLDGIKSHNWVGE